MTIPFLDLSAPLPDVQDAIDEAVRRVQRRGAYVLGPEVEAFEQEFAAYIGASHCVGVNSGTDALQLVLRALGVGPGDEVVVPAYTAVATWMAVSLTGAAPVGVDVDEATFLMDCDALARAITKRTRAVVPVHLLGGVCDVDAVARAVGDASIPIIEDTAQAHGARHAARRAGSMGHAAAFSFYPTKNLGALGDGGAVVTNDAYLAERIRLLRTYGWSERSVSRIKGMNSRLDEMQAAILRAKLPALDAWNHRRRELAALYREELAGIPGLTLAVAPDDVEPVWHLFVVMLERRDDVRAALEARGVQTLVHYEPLPHLTPAYLVEGYAEGAFPVAERLSRMSLSLPLHPKTEERDVRGVATALRQILGGDV